MYGVIGAMQRALLQCALSSGVKLSVISVEAFSGLLLDIYRDSQEYAMKEFQFYSLERIRSLIPFDAVWWALSTEMENGRHCVHDSYLWGIPDDSPDLANLSLQDNIVKEICMRSPGICFNCTPELLFSEPHTAALSQHMEVMHALCTAWQGGAPKLTTFISLQRRDRASPFSEDERRLKQCLMPHLAGMQQTNRVMHIASIRANDSGSRSAMAVVDEVGMLHAAEPGFEFFMKLEWSDWTGPFLPKPLLNSFLANSTRFFGSQLSIRLERVRESTLVTVRRRAPSDLLSARERLVADGFAGGESYKEVARRLGISPATVRYHLRSAYVKLGVSDKGELARLLGVC